MKVKIAVAALLLAIGICIPGTIKADTSCKHSQKIYVMPEQITLNADGMKVSLSNGEFVMMHLSKDTNGYYVFASDLLQTKRAEYYFCDKCDFIGRSPQEIYWHKRDHR